MAKLASVMPIIPRFLVDLDTYQLTLATLMTGLAIKVSGWTVAKWWGLRHLITPQTVDVLLVRGRIPFGGGLCFRHTCLCRVTVSLICGRSGRCFNEVRHESLTVGNSGDNYSPEVYARGPYMASPG